MSGQTSQPETAGPPVFEIRDGPRDRSSTAAAPDRADPERPPSVPRMDAKAFGRLKRGKLAPEARIDLHGMTLAEAHPALTNFILASHARGLRLVLVITGKGSREPNGFPYRRGVLRHQVPQWLKMAPTGSRVLEVMSAHRRHGGDGALYVYLRRGH